METATNNSFPLNQISMLSMTEQVFIHTLVQLEQLMSTHTLQYFQPIEYHRFTVCGIFRIHIDIAI